MNILDKIINIQIELNETMKQFHREHGIPIIYDFNDEQDSFCYIYHLPNGKTRFFAIARIETLEPEDMEKVRQRIDRFHALLLKQIDNE